MTEQTALPISRFRPQAFADHPAGTLLIVTPWSSKPAELCLAVKLAGLTDGGKAIESALVIQGSPYGDPKNCAGDIVSDVGEGARYLSGPVLGLEGTTRVDMRHDTHWDLSQQRSWRNARGCAVLGGFGMRICGGGGDLQRFYSWGVAINPDKWSVNEEISNVHIAGVASDWIFVWQDGDHEVRIPVTASGFQVAE